MSVLQKPPFTDQGNIVEVFTDLTLWAGIRDVIRSINANAGMRGLFQNETTHGMFSESLFFAQYSCTGIQLPLGIAVHPVCAG